MLLLTRSRAVAPYVFFSSSGPILRGSDFAEKCRAFVPVVVPSIILSEGGLAFADVLNTRTFRYDIYAPFLSI